MGARTTNRKRCDEGLSFNHTYPYQNSSDFHVLKKPRFSSIHQTPDRPASSNSTVARLSRYPQTTPRLGREVHAPCRILNYGFSSTCLTRKSGPRTSGIYTKEDPLDEMGGTLSYKYNKAKNSALRTIRYLINEKEKEKEVIEIDTDYQKDGGVSEDSSIEVVEVLEDGRGGWSEVSEHREVDNGVVANVQDEHAKVLDGLLPSTSSAISDLTNGNLRVDDAQKMLNSLQLNPERDMSVSAFKKLLEVAERRNPKLRNLSFEIELNEERRSMLQSLRPAKTPVEVKLFYLLSK